MAIAAQVDFVVVGSGVAGLRAALELANVGEVLIVTKEAIRESNTHYAQGGIAVALEGERDVQLHLDDTIAAGAGIVSTAAAQILVTEGPGRVRQFIGWGACFDTANGQLVRTREGAHSLPRILHAAGDATGREVGRALAACVRANPRLRVAEWTQVTALVVDGQRVVGVDLAAAQPGAPTGIRRVLARAVLLATGGAGHVYSDTTNPAIATGDGLALAADAGAALADMEFYQFHPTAFFLPGAPRFLLSEALRGEGAWLRNDRGHRFMPDLDPMAELAPRDVVARAIAREGMDEQGHPRPVFLDMRQVSGLDPAVRFPAISSFLASHGLSLGRDLIPVRPAAHYMMGGIATDLDGRTAVAGLYAAGEAACTGLHGANRLASNSLLEGLVFGARAGAAMAADAGPLPNGRSLAEPQQPTGPLTGAEQQQVDALIVQIGQNLWRTAGLLRSAELLGQGLGVQRQIAAELATVAAGQRSSRRLAEAEALSRVAESILLASLARTESRGAHFRIDYPERDDRSFAAHSMVQAAQVRFRSDLVAFLRLSRPPAFPLVQPQPGCDTEDMADTLPTLIFDLDGTLTDSKPGILGCLRQVIDQRKLGDQGSLDRFIGPPVEQWVEELLPNGNQDERAALARDYRSCYDREGWSNNSVFPGIREELVALHRAGFPLYVCTSKQQHFAERILASFELAPLFRAIYGDKAEYEDHSKPSLLARLLAAESIDPANAWMIGDRIHDIEAAQACGVRSMAAGWGYGNIEEHTLADAFAATPASIATHVRQ